AAIRAAVLISAIYRADATATWAVAHERLLHRLTPPLRVKLDGFERRQLFLGLLGPQRHHFAVRFEDSVVFMRYSNGFSLGRDNALELGDLDAQLSGFNVFSHSNGSV